MIGKNLMESLRFYFITDYDAEALSVVDQVKLVLQAGVTTIQYRNKTFCLQDYDDAVAIREMCLQSGIMFIVNDNVLLAKALDADGVHVGQDDEKISLVRKILGPSAVLGLSVSSIGELKEGNIQECNYIGVGPVFDTNTKFDAKSPHGLNVLGRIVLKSSVPTVAIGGIDPGNAKLCMDYGAIGVAVISCITRSDNPYKSATELARVCLK